MKVDEILDPLVRVAFTKKRDADLLQEAADSTLKNIQAMQDEYAYQLTEAADARAELQALMAAMTPMQHQDLVLAELQLAHAATQKAQAQAGNFFGGITAAHIGASYSAGSWGTTTYITDSTVPAGLQLHKDDSELNGLQVVWRK